MVVYIRGANLIYADDGNIIYYHFNAHGDVVALTNENGAKTKSYAYSAFGVEYSPSDFDDNPFRYCGEYFDKETNTIYLRARYYNAEQGRFTQEDPIRDGDNWYSYCDGNPIMFVDPTGLSKGLSKKTRLVMQKLNDHLNYEPPSSSESLVPPSTNFSVEQQNDISTGLLIAAGVSATFDGPLPIGDIVGIVLLVVGIFGKTNSQTIVVNNSFDFNLAFREVDLTKIARKYLWYQCEEAAQEMLRKNRNLGNVIQLYFPEAHWGFVVSDRYPTEAISSNGKHYGYLYNGIVYCNIYPEGLPKDEWINSFHCASDVPPIVTII